jgi:NTE family protein
MTTLRVRADTSTARRDLRDVPAFAGVDDEALQMLADLAQVIDLPSGQVLHQQGSPATGFYAVMRGRIQLGVNDRVTGFAERLSTIGGTAVLSGEAHSATARAVRDSTLLRFDADVMEAFFEKQPAGYRALVRALVSSMRHARARGTGPVPTRGTFAVVPSSVHVPVKVLAETMITRLSGWPNARLVAAAHVDAALGPGTARSPLSDGEASARIAAWLDDMEERHPYLVFAADSGRDPWAARCVHNADRILVLAEAMATPMAVPVLEDLRRKGMIAPVELVLLRPEGDQSPHTLDWRKVTGARAHYFVHPWDRIELDSLARQVTGRGTALVLGGGGARGFAHIGLVRAMEDLGLTIDVCGGTSMGAFISALVACGYHSTDMTEICRETFVRSNYLNDYTMPRASLIKGRKFAARLQDIFGSRTIEELRRTYFCVATNLTTGEPVVADRGPLATWTAISMAVPGVAPPIAHEGDLLCDGGVVDNLPIIPMRRLERGRIIACNVSTDGALRAPGAGIGEPDLEAVLNWKGATAIPKLPEILVRTATLSSAVAMEAAAEGADAYVRMPVQDFGMFDWKRLDELVDLGYDHARRQLAALKDTLV